VGAGGIAPDLTPGNFSIFLCLEMAYFGVFVYAEFHTYQESVVICQLREGIDLPPRIELLWEHASASHSLRVYAVPNILWYAVRTLHFHFVFVFFYDMMY